MSKIFCKFARKFGWSMITHLYKYRDNPQYIEDIIVNHRLYLPTPSQFEDPKDCHLPIEDLTISRANELKQINPLMQLVSDEYIQEVLSAGKDEIWDEVKNQIGVLSLCRTWESSYMWDMYANKGNGICFEFDMQRLTKHFDSRFLVHYEEPQSVDIWHNREDEVKRMLTIKKVEYKEEQEVRLLKKISECEKQYVNIDPLCITRIIFGDKYPKSHMPHIVRLCEKHGLGHVKFDYVVFHE